jgi:hypothetical protein
MFCAILLRDWHKDKKKELKISVIKNNTEWSIAAVVERAMAQVPFSSKTTAWKYR